MTSTIRDRINSFDWPTIHTSLHASGWARTGEVLTHEECRAVRDLYTDEARFRSKVVMARHRFGLGEYKYFGSPLPELVVELRESLYTHLAAVANEWAGQLDLKTHYPATHREFIRQCHARGQKRPTPLLLRYESGGFKYLPPELFRGSYFSPQKVFLLDEALPPFLGGGVVLGGER